MTQPDMTFLITNYSFLYWSPNTMGLQTTSHAQKDGITWLDHNSPYMTEFYIDYIIGIYMTFTSNDRYDIYNQYQRAL